MPRFEKLTGEFAVTTGEGVDEVLWRFARTGEIERAFTLADAARLSSPPGHGVGATVTVTTLGLMLRALVGWEGVFDVQGRPIAYSQEAFHQYIPAALRMELLRQWTRRMRGQSAQTSGPQPAVAPGSADDVAAHPEGFTAPLPDGRAPFGESTLPGPPTAVAPGGQATVGGPVSRQPATHPQPVPPALREAQPVAPAGPPAPQVRPAGAPAGVLGTDADDPPDPAAAPPSAAPCEAAASPAVTSAGGPAPHGDSGALSLPGGVLPPNGASGSGRLASSDVPEAAVPVPQAAALAPRLAHVSFPLGEGASETGSPLEDPHLDMDSRFVDPVEEIYWRLRRAEANEPLF